MSDSSVHQLCYATTHPTKVKSENSHHALTVRINHAPCETRVMSIVQPSFSIDHNSVLASCDVSEPVAIDSTRPRRPSKGQKGIRLLHCDPIGFVRARLSLFQMLMMALSMIWVMLVLRARPFQLKSRGKAMRRGSYLRDCLCREWVPDDVDRVIAVLVLALHFAPLLDHFPGLLAGPHC